ncbi:uncharacterized protein CEXT_355501, isoform D [Caerostris extrusa]|uniref:Uncharacterized protein, isoform D n=1 Tax=Caerostris extrusa TaxID=172846 RepID=A0AAV4RUT5_CAEEX|nr:uncharacterized protein CEXT_355501, isoform D [Caerostris extrusa]
MCVPYFTVNPQRQARSKIGSASRRRSKRHVSVVYPEILLVVDYDSYESFGYNDKRVVSYYSSLLTSIDARFRELTNPRVQISLSSILIAKRRDMIPFVEHNQLDSNQNMIDGIQTLIDFYTYLYHSRQYIRPYDIAVIMTKYNLCSRPSGAGCMSQVSGLANVGAACQIDNVGIVQDTGGPRGVSVAAHEIGHLHVPRLESFEAPSKSLSVCIRAKNYRQNCLRSVGSKSTTSNGLPLQIF